MNEGVDQGREDKEGDLIRREDIENTFKVSILDSSLDDLLANIEHSGRTGESEVLWRLSSAFVAFYKPLYGNPFPLFLLAGLILPRGCKVSELIGFVVMWKSFLNYIRDQR